MAMWRPGTCLRESIQVTDRMRDSGERDDQKSGPGRPSATKVRPAGTAPGRTGGPKSDEPQPLTKAERRARAKERKARAIRAKKRRQAMLGVLAGLGVVVVIVGAALLIGHYAGKKSTAASASASAPASAVASVAPSPTVSFPPVPAGADPALRTKPTVDPPSGTVTSLQPKLIITGTGPKVASGQTITVNYVGVSFKDGKEFDSSWSRSQAFTTQIGTGSVIKGWDQGLVGVPVGSRVQLDIPSDLAYGDNPSGGQPGGPLRFVVDVLAAS
jgi:peptidylprolyl isomerase